MAVAFYCFHFFSFPFAFYYFFGSYFVAASHCCSFNDSQRGEEAVKEDEGGTEQRQGGRKASEDSGSALKIVALMSAKASRRLKVCKFFVFFGCGSFQSFLATPDATGRRFFG